METTDLDFNSWIHLQKRTGEKNEVENTEGPGSLGGIKKKKYSGRG